jgi:hypothetical protein
MPKKSKQKYTPPPQLQRVPNAIYRGIVSDFNYMLISENVLNNLKKSNELIESNEDDPSINYDIVTGSSINAIKMIKKLNY